jgi:hypothetical protein
MTNAILKEEEKKSLLIKLIDLAVLFLPISTARSIPSITNP